MFSVHVDVTIVLDIVTCIVGRDQARAQRAEGEACYGALAAIWARLPSCGQTHIRKLSFRRSLSMFEPDAAWDK